MTTTFNVLDAFGPEPWPNTTSPEHSLVGFVKYPSRRGGLKGAKCRCGWVGRPADATGRMSDFQQHLQENKSKKD